jgi:nucleoside-diphosphate-sugar epimerase
MARVLVTGAGGFLGFHITKLLIARGDQVVAFSRKRYEKLEALGVASIQGDVRDSKAVEQACRGMEIVFHTAAVAGIWGPWEHYHGINTVGTEHLLRACQLHRVGRLVFSSSPSVTFDGQDQCGVDESAPYPTSWYCHYPHSKALAEQAVLAANDPRGLLTCALRPHLIWGPGDPHLVPRLLQRARSGRLRQVGDGTNQIDMVFVENAALAHLQAADALTAESPVAGSSYFISQGEPVNCWNWINELLSLDELPPLRKKISFQAAWRLGAVCETVFRLLRIRSEPPMTRFLAAQLGKSHYFNIDRARRDFGYVPQVSTQQGMERLAAWIRGR